LSKVRGEGVSGQGLNLAALTVVSGAWLALY